MPMPKRPSDRTLDYLSRAFSYNPETGALTWAIPHGCGNREPANKPVTTLSPYGYLVVRCGPTSERRLFFAHHICWFLQTGEWPPLEIDHADLEKTNNRWTNLRLATRQQNMANRNALRVSKSGIRGVQLLPSGRWRAFIKLESGTTHLGVYDTPELASAAYLDASQKRYGPFARN